MGFQDRSVHYFFAAAFFFGAAFFAVAAGFAAAFNCTAAAVNFRAVSAFRLARVSLLLATVFPVPLFPLRSLALFVVIFFLVGRKVRDNGTCHGPCSDFGII